MSNASSWDVLSASTITGDTVVNARGEELGKIEDIMLDLDHGRISYAVLSFGGFLGMGDKLFAVPWGALEVDKANKCVRLDVPKEKLEAAPGFDKSNWPSDSDPSFIPGIYKYYGSEQYW